MTSKTGVSGMKAQKTGSSAMMGVTGGGGVTKENPLATFAGKSYSSSSTSALASSTNSGNNNNSNAITSSSSSSLVSEKSRGGIASSKSRDALSNVTNSNSTSNNASQHHTTKSAKKADSKVSNKDSKAGGGGGGAGGATSGKDNSKSSKRSASVASLLEPASAAVAAVNAASASSATSSGAITDHHQKHTHKKTKSDAMVIVSEEDSSSISGALHMHHQLGGMLGAVGGGNICRVMPNIPHEDIDAEDHSDPQSVHEYVNDIYVYLMAKERTDRLTPNLLSRQTEVTEKMRAILIDWLIEVHRMFKLLPETLFLAVNIIDRYLDARSVLREKLQLVGITSMLIASKYEEIYAPECNDFVYISDSAYAKEEILSMEQNILNVLDFNLTHPSPLHFLRRYSKAAGSDYTAHTLCKYLIELTLIDVKMLKYTASQVAASSVYIARSMMKKTPVWSQTMVYYSTYTEQEVREVALEMNDLLKKIGKSSLKAIKKKYGTAKFSNVSDMPWVDL